MNIAVIDIGSNSVRMQISKVENGTFYIIEEYKKMLRIGDDVFGDGYIKEKSIDNLAATLNEMKKLYESKEVQKLRAVATASFREAKNAEDVVDSIYKKTGVKIDIISGEEEAKLDYIGVSANFELKKTKALITDIGGGSTEFIIVEDEKMNYRTSTPYGCNKLLQQYFRHDPVKDSEILEFKNKMEEGLKNLPIDRSIEHVICLGGTLNNISFLKNSTASRVKYVDRKFLKSFLRNIIDKTIEERQKIKRLEPKRADIVLPAALFIDKVLDLTGSSGFYTLSGGLRSGLTIDTINKMGIVLDFQTRQHSLRLERIMEIGKKFNFERKHALQVKKISLFIFDKTSNLHSLGVKERNILEAAALLHDCGNYISYSKHHKHSYYLIKNSDFIGYGLDDVELVANVARYHRKSLPKLTHENFFKLNEYEKKTVRILAGILRIADALDRTHEGKIHSLDIQTDKEKIVFRASTKSDLLLEIRAFNAKKDLFEDVFNKKVQLV